VERLFDADPTRRATALTALTDALAQYRSLSGSLTTLNEAKRLRDQGLVFLPAYGPYLEYNPANEKAWQQAVETASALEELLAQPNEGMASAKTLQRLSELTMTLSDNLNVLRQPLKSPWVKGLIDARQLVSGTDSVEMGVLLQLPGLSAPERAVLWNNYRTVADRLHKEAVENEKTTEALSPYDRAAAARKERERALVRAQTSLALIKLFKAKDLERVDAEMARVKATPTEEGAWLALSRALREAWKQHEADRVRDDKN
jgi:hypothetical protein